MSTVATEVAVSTAVAFAAAASSASTDSRYFDLHITGIGYLNRARELKLRKGSFLAVDVSALRGEADKVEYTKFDCRVSGTEAQSVIRQFMPDIEAKKKVLVGFKLGDLYPRTFVYDQGERKGQTGLSLKAHLLRISWVKVDGQMVYQAPRENGAAASESAELQAAA